MFHAPFFVSHKCMQIDGRGFMLVFKVVAKSRSPCVDSRSRRKNYSIQVVKTMQGVRG